jgi:hypothetical protein
VITGTGAPWRDRSSAAHSPYRSERRSAAASRMLVSTSSIAAGSGRLPGAAGGGHTALRKKILTAINDTIDVSFMAHN